MIRNSFADMNEANVHKTQKPLPPPSHNTSIYFSQEITDLNPTRIPLQNDVSFVRTNRQRKLESRKSPDFPAKFYTVKKTKNKSRKILIGLGFHE